MGKRKYKTNKSPIHGNGVFAVRVLRAGEEIGRFRCRIARRPTRGPSGRLYAMERDEGGFLVPVRPVGLWLINHSCNANTEIIASARSARLIAQRAIRPGEELTCDYRPSLHCGRLRCRCGAPGCTGRL